MSKHKSSVAILMGSDSDLSTMKDAMKALDEFGVKWEAHILSAHRTPREMSEFSESARAKGFRVLIAGAGGAAHLPGMLAAHTDLPVIGVPVCVGSMNGLDALYSIVQMPKGVPVATVAIGQSYNAGLLAVQMLSTHDTDPESRILATKLKAYKESLRKMVYEKEVKLQKKIREKLAQKPNKII